MVYSTQTSLGSLVFGDKLLNLKNLSVVNVTKSGSVPPNATLFSLRALSGTSIESIVQRTAVSKKLFHKLKAIIWFYLKKKVTEIQFVPMFYKMISLCTTSFRNYRLHTRHLALKIVPLMLQRITSNIK